MSVGVCNALHNPGCICGRLCSEAYQKLETALATAERQAFSKGVLQAEVDSLTETLRMKNGQVEDMILQIRAWKEAVNRMCSCGGKGPLDPGVCQACGVYHSAKRMNEVLPEKRDESKCICAPKMPGVTMFGLPCPVHAEKRKCECGASITPEGHVCGYWNERR